MLRRTTAPIAGVLVAPATPPIAGLQDTAPGDERPTMAATRVEQGSTIDGNLSDRAWRQSEVGGNFIQHEPVDGVPATEQTEVRVAFTDSTIYFGIAAFDANPDAIIAKEMERDSRIFQDDSLLLLLDTFHDRRTTTTPRTWASTSACTGSTSPAPTCSSSTTRTGWPRIFGSASARTARSRSSSPT